MPNYAGTYSDHTAAYLGQSANLQWNTSSNNGTGQSSGITNACSTTYYIDYLIVSGFTFPVGTTASQLAQPFVSRSVTIVGSPTGSINDYFISLVRWNPSGGGGMGMGAFEFGNNLSGGAAWSSGIVSYDEDEAFLQDSDLTNPNTQHTDPSSNCTMMGGVGVAICYDHTLCGSAEDTFNANVTQVYFTLSPSPAMTTGEMWCASQGMRSERNVRRSLPVVLPYRCQRRRRRRRRPLTVEAR